MKKLNLFFIGLMIFAGCEYNYYEASKTYNLRDRGPAGGWIFYINPNYETDGWKYMEAAPVDQSSIQAWSNFSGSQTGAWEVRSIGSGPANTEAIIAQVGHTSSAALLCRNYRGGGKNDWFLPSYSEQYQMYLNLKVYGIGGFANQQYWSSTDNNATGAYEYNFSGVGSGTVPKSDITTYTRAARRF